MDFVGVRPVVFGGVRRMGTSVAAIQVFAAASIGRQPVICAVACEVHARLAGSRVFFTAATSGQQVQLGAAFRCVAARH